MIRPLFEKLPEILQVAIERLQKSPYANSSPQRKNALRRLMKQIESQTTELSKFIKGNVEELTEQEKDIILKELDKKLRGE
jgi:vacuolar-type H+-ATPase subunit I/STV1